MISERELRRIAAKTGASVGQSEHEYVLLCVLDALGQTPPLSDTFCLKGGTALRLIHFDDWRHSVDLDFSVLPTFPANELRTLVEVWFAQTTAQHGIEMRLLDFHRVNGAARMRVRFVAPLRHPARLLFDITLDEPVLLPPQPLQVLVSPFPSLRPVVLTYALEEILAEKIRSILQRGKARDYYDVWRLLGEKRDAFDASLVRSILTQKCRHKGLNEPKAQDLLQPQPLAEAGIYWERDLVGQVATRDLPDWTMVTEDLARFLTDFFAAP
jgi:predicted nucleotidyltransferase component of viral defense system